MMVEAILQGLHLLKFWEVWASVGVYMIVYFAFMILLFLISGDDVSGTRETMGCLFTMIATPVLNGALMGLLVAYLLPIMLGASQATPLSSLFEWIWPLVKAGVVAAVTVTVLCFIPFIGGFIANSDGLQAFLEGVIIFRIYSDGFIHSLLQEANVTGQVYPGILESIIFLVIAGVLVRALMYTIAMLATVSEGATVILAVVVGPGLSILGGIIPLFMYSQYAKLSLIKLLG